eukprot:14642383-Ditylum_brightwellii.AAC.1
MGLIVWMVFLQVTFQGILERLDLAEDLGLAVPLTNAFTNIINCHFIPIRAEVDVLGINTPREQIDGFVVDSKARMKATFNRALDVGLTILEDLQALSP